MSTYFVNVLFLVVMVIATGGVAKRRHKEASTTFLRLTALRSDEGLWTTRFADYEISIELKHHPNARGDGECNDTWSLKLKHAPKRFMIPEDKSDPTGNEIDREITHEPSFQTSETRETWKKIVDSLDDNDEEDSPVFKKAHAPKKKKAKTRRQLSTKTYTSTTEKNDINLGETAGAYTNEPVVLSELVQGSNRINVFFDNTEENKNKPLQKTDEQFEEVNEKPWKHIAAVIYQGAILRNDSQKDTIAHTPEVERLSDSFALPLQQSSQTRYYDNMLDTPFDQDTATPENYNPDTWQVPEDVTVEEVTEESATNTSEEVDLEPGVSFGNDIVKPQNSSTDSWEVPEDVTVENGSEEPPREDSQETVDETDYVIEDTLTDADDDENVGSEAESTEVDFSELEVPPEMKRIMEWYPRSKPLSTLNNGYKLFPGVGWFKFVPWAERWSNAKKVCESEKAHLAIPDSKQKVRIFLQIFRNFPDVLEQSILSNQAYVGVYSRGLHRNMTTVLDKQFQPRFPIWFPGEPDNADPGEDCVTFHAEGKIRDVPCFYNLPFLCEKEPDIS